MTTSTLSKLEVGNNILNACGERSQQSLSGVLGNTITSSLTESALFISNSHEWTELRSVINATSWSSDSATLPDDVYRVRNVYWYTSPTGLPATDYDYYDEVIPNIDLEEYRSQSKTPFDSNENSPNVWAVYTKNVVLVNPYPNNSLARGKVKFEVFREISIPASDTGYFTVSDMMVNLIQYKATELFCVKYTNDLNLAQYFNKVYNDLMKQNVISDSPRKNASLNMYKRNRTRRYW